MFSNTSRWLGFIVAVAAVSGLSACQKHDEQAAETTTASVTEPQTMPMSAAPADDDNNAPPLINENTAALDAGPDVNANAASADASVNDQLPAATGADGEPLEGAVDNSGMDSISENDQVIDNEPADPNAPKATDSDTAAQR